MDVNLKWPKVILVSWITVLPGLLARRFLPPTTVFGAQEDLSGPTLMENGEIEP